MENQHFSTEVHHFCAGTARKSSFFNGNPMGNHHLCHINPHLRQLKHALLKPHVLHDGVERPLRQEVLHLLRVHRAALVAVDAEKQFFQDLVRDRLVRDAADLSDDVFKLEKIELT